MLCEIKVVNAPKTKLELALNQPATRVSGIKKLRSSSKVDQARIHHRPCSRLLLLYTPSSMSFRASIPRLAAQPAASSSSSSSAAARILVNRAPPKHLRAKVKRAEAREAEYALRVAEAKAKGLPIPRFKPLVVPENLQWYKVGRSSGGELPVYTDVRADGGYKTILKRIEVGCHGIDFV